MEQWKPCGRAARTCFRAGAGNPHLLQSLRVLWSSGSCAGEQPALASKLGGGGGEVRFVEQWKPCGRATRKNLGAEGCVLWSSGRRAGGQPALSWGGVGAFCGAV